MPGLSAGELTIVVFILLLVVVAGRLPRWGEALGSYLYKRGNPAQAQDAGLRASHAGSSPETPGSGSPGQGPSSQVPPPN